MMSVREYIDCTDEDLRRDYEEHIYDNVFQCFLSTLPLNPPEVDLGDISIIMEPIWTDGTEILCRTEDIADRVAKMLDAIAGSPESHIGYYDPFEDARSGEVDDHTGFYYVDFD